MSDPDRPEGHRDPVDPDVDLSVPDQRAELHGHHPAVIGAIAAGGLIGALARYQIGRWWAAPAGGFPAATLTINVSGCLLIGVLMVCIGEAVRPRPLARPFLGTGILGGFTTFSTCSVELQHLLDVGAVGTALGYLAATALGAVAATGGGMFLTRRFIGRTAPVV